MNKKILYWAVSLATITLPMAVYAAAPAQVTTTLESVKDGFVAIGSGIVIIGWIVTGILYLTAAGGSRMETAKKSLIACVIGTALIIISATAETFISGIFNLTKK